jgi:hypothetical protein
MTGTGILGAKLAYLATYRLSQENIETVFSLVRRRGGWSNNPTAFQFKYIYRAILSHVDVSVSISANILQNEFEDIGNEADDTDDDMFSEDNGSVVDNPYFSRLPKLTSYVENVCSYIAGFVVRKLMPRLKCTNCRELLVALPRTDASHNYFLKLKDNGGLVTPSEGVV